MQISGPRCSHRGYNICKDPLHSLVSDMNSKNSYFPVSFHLGGVVSWPFYTPVYTAPYTQL